MKIGPLLAHLDELEAAYAGALQASAQRNGDEADVYHQCLTFVFAADAAAIDLASLRQRYQGEPEWTSTTLGHGETLLEELRSLYLLAHGVAVTWAMAGQAARAARDAELEEHANDRHTEVDAQAKWFLTRIKSGAPQALVVE
jgi:hypothetical protein